MQHRNGRNGHAAVEGRPSSPARRRSEPTLPDPDLAPSPLVEPRDALPRERMASRQRREEQPVPVKQPPDGSHRNEWEERRQIRFYLGQEDIKARKRRRGWRIASIVLIVAGALLGVWAVSLMMSVYTVGPGQALGSIAPVLILAGIVILAIVELKRMWMPSGEDYEASYDKLYWLDRQMRERSADSMLAITDPDDVLGSYTFEGLANRHYLAGKKGIFLGARIGSDKRVRYSPCAVTRLTFTGEQVSSYEGGFDVVTGKPLYEVTREFFYQDLVSVNRTREILAVRRLDDSLDNRRQRVAALETFKLELSNGESISIVLSDGYPEGAVDAREQPNSTSEEMIRIIRKLVQDKKKQSIERMRAGDQPSPFSDAFDT